MHITPSLAIYVKYSMRNSKILQKIKKAPEELIPQGLITIYSRLSCHHPTYLSVSNKFSEQNPQYDPHL
jgi:hypothetical protein